MRLRRMLAFVLIYKISKYTCCDTFLKRFAAMVRAKAPLAGQEEEWA
jgi:hypothetical protein